MRHVAKNLCLSDLFGLLSVVIGKLHCDNSEYLQRLLFGLQIFHYLFCCSSLSEKVI